MIVCPWCGTNYEAFQSSCGKCGGPIQMPVQAAKAVEHDAPPILPPLAPPPAPRSISASYTRRLMVTDGPSIAGFVLSLIGSIFTVLGVVLTLVLITAFIGIPFALLGLVLLAAGGTLLYWRYQESEKITNVLRWGEPVLGEITSVCENYSVSINNRHPWEIEYRYRIQGQDYSGKVTTLNLPGPALQPGRSIYVLYLPDAPQRSALYPHP